MSSENTLSFQLHRTSFLKINKVPTFSEITQALQCVNIVFIQSDEYTC